MLSETIIIFLIASSSALCGIVLKYSFESKCRNIDICCIHITRDIENASCSVALWIYYIPSVRITIACVIN